MHLAKRRQRKASARGIWGEASGARHLGERHLGRGIWGEASGERHLGREASRERHLGRRLRGGNVHKSLPFPKCTLACDCFAKRLEGYVGVTIYWPVR